MPSPRVLIAGVSTRAAAESAVRAGYDVVGVDAYADLDHPSECHTLPRGVAWRTAAAVKVAGRLRADAAVYLSSFENDPRAVASLGERRALWGNPPDVLRRARNPLLVRDAFRAAGVDAPDVRLAPERLTAGDWVVKPLRSGGGAGVRRWRGGRLPRGYYAQARIDGEPGSVVFAAAGGHAAVLGTTRQLVGDAAFGATGFRYCGNVLLGWPDASRPEEARAIAAAAAAAFGLVGVGSVDFIDDGRVLHPIEVNPRWTAPMELVERAHGLSAFAAHVTACHSDVLPRDLLAPAATYGKAVVFARHDVTVGDTREWLGDSSVRDIPRPESRIVARQPVCTVLAHGDCAETCYRALVRRAGRVYAQLEEWARVAA